MEITEIYLPEMHASPEVSAEVPAYSYSEAWVPGVNDVLFAPFFEMQRRASLGE